MDTEENKPVPMPEPAPQPGLAELRESVNSLQNLVFALLLVCLIISGTVWLYLRRQVKYTSGDLEAFRAQATNFIAQNQKSGPMVDDFIRKLAEFGRTHQDFVPVLARYGINPTSAPPTNATAPKKATAAPAPAKK